MLSRSVITILARSQCHLISWLQSSSAVNLETKEIKSLDVSIGSPYHEVMGPNVMNLVFWMFRIFVFLLLFIYFFWQIIALQIFVVFCQTSTWINHQSVSQFSCSVMSDSLRPHESQHSRPPCPSPNPGVHSNSCPSSRWWYSAISASVIPFSSCPQSLPGSGSFPMSQLFSWGGQSIGVSALASVLPMNSQDWSPLGWTGWISLQSKGLSRVFSNTTVQNH